MHCVESMWNLLASLLLARACPSSEQPFVPLVFQHLDWMKRVLLSEVFLSFWRIPFDNFCCGYLWYLQRQPPCRDGTSKQGSVHDPDFNEYFVIEMAVDNIILLCFSLPFLLIFESQISKTDFLAKKHPDPQYRTPVLEEESCRHPPQCSPEEWEELKNLRA